LANRITKKFTRIAAIILGILLALLIGFHFWFINHAETLIEGIVEKQSKGKLHLNIEKFRFNWFNRKMELRQAVFYSTDTATASTAYRFRVDKIKIQVREILPLIFEKKFYIDSIHLFNPEISVTKLRSKDTIASRDTNLSIPQEMGRIYNSIQDALQVLQVNRLQIDNGTFSLINKIRPDEKPIIISRLYFHLDNLQVDSSEANGQKKILFSDNVVLQTTHQSILFPDGRHKLSFSNFRINIRNRLAEFDSCTIIATRGDSANNSFRIFFDKLRMTNIDFDTLYHTEVIKADSVYCINPRFRLDVELPKRTGPVKPPKLDELIQQLTGNIQLGFVVVQNGSFDINTMREGRPSSFTSDHNNFELQGLKIQETAPRPLTVERFAMAIRNYENFLRDSAYSIRFDSVLLNNNRISLSNFSYQELKNNKVVNSLAMPQFELYGLSWDDLVFDQQLNADHVTLIRPVIKYNVVPNKRQPQDIFQLLTAVGNILQLNNVDIIDGQVDLLLSNHARLQLEGTTMSVLGKQLVASRRLTSIQQSVTGLTFKKGVFTSGELTARLGNVQFQGANNGLKAGSVYIQNKNLSINAGNVAINAMIMDDRQLQTTIRGMQWQQADVRLSLSPGAGSASGNFILQNIQGANTRIVAEKAGRNISVFLKNISADAFSLLKNQPVQLTGLVANGTGLDITDSTMQVHIKSLNIADRQSSSLKDVAFSSYTLHDSVRVAIPSLSFTPDIQAMLQGQIRADAVTLFHPFVTVSLFATDTSSSSAKNSLPGISIGKLVIRQPNLQFRSTTPKGVSTLEWTGKESSNWLEISSLAVSDAESKTLSAGELRFSMDDFRYTDAKGKTFDAGNGQLSARVNQLSMQKNKTGSWDWEGILSNLAARNFIIDSLGKKGGTLTIASAKLSDLSISAASLQDIRELVSHNTRFNLQEVTGSYHNADNQFDWYNAGYNRLTGYFSADSFSYRPTLEKEAFIKAQTYQNDYMTFKTGRLGIGPFDIRRYIRDSILEVGVVTVNGGYLSNYRDKRLPRPPGVIRLLPVNLLKKIPVRLLVDTVKISNANIDYTELNEKTLAEGTITVNRLNASITDMRNFNMTDRDSLLIRASAFLQDTILTKLQVKESYTDSLVGFLMTAQMGPADLTILNPVLIPLAGAELKSAQLDTMTMRVVGREYLAFGEMTMYYHELKVRIVRPGKKRSFFTGIITFFANTLIKNENTHRTGTVFFQRLRDRSAINYLVKIALSGVTSSVGVKRNKKLVRKYRKEIKNRRLPAIEPDHL
jgi:hypothetical protein